MNTEAWIEDVEALASERLHQPSRPKSLTVLYDPGCELCRRCRTWMLGQPAFLPIRFLQYNSAEAKEHYGQIPWLGDELVVVSNDDEIWVGAAAFIVCLWALTHYREWSFRLSGTAFAPMAERFFHTVSSNRGRVSAFLSHECSSGTCRVAATRAQSA